MDITDYLSSRTATIVRNPKYNVPQHDDTLGRMNGGYAKPNLQMDVTKSMIIPPLNTDISFSSDLPQHIGYHLNIAGGPKLPVAQPSDVSRELAAYLGVKHLPSTEDMYNPQYVHMLDNLKKKPMVKENFTDEPELVIPPLNTDVRFAETLPYFIDEEVNASSHTYRHQNEQGVFDIRSIPAAGSSEHDSSKLHIHDHEHENFSWTIPTDHDDRHSLNKKLRIGPVLDQQGCGSCWAFAVASTMSDCLVVGEAVEYDPRISATFCLACYPQGRCAGGRPAELALLLEKYGCGDQSCLDYSWCDGDQMCNIRDSSQHFNIDSSRLSALVPNCGCMFKNNKYIYFLDKGTDTFSITQDMSVEKFRRLVKYHILDFGPVIGGYVVLTNFQNGSFTQSNGGVYFDRADYDNIASDGTIPFSDSVKSSINSAGLHAVSIVGWGIAKNVQYDNNKRGDVPFWYCRNSWGEKWGDKGFFKMAMYPYNLTSQFDKVVTIQLRQGSLARIGGLMFIRATKQPKVVQINEIDPRYKNSIKLNHPEQFYNRDVIPGLGIIADKVKSQRTNVCIIGMAVLLVVIVLLLKRQDKCAEMTRRWNEVFG